MTLFNNNDVWYRCPLQFCCFSFQFAHPCISFLKDTWTQYYLSNIHLICCTSLIFFRLFDVTCISDNAETLSAVVNDMTGGLEGLYSHLFTMSDGVLAGTDYICTIQLNSGGYQGGQSSFAYVTTLTTSGMCYN